MAYDKHEWVTDEIITAELLNNIEDGIEAVDEAVTIESGTDGLISGTVQEVLQALATRIQALEDAE